MWKSKCLSIYLAAAAIWQPAEPTQLLSKALAEDMVLNSSPTCTGNPNTSFEFNFNNVNTSSSHWSGINAGKEKSVFMVEISNGIDPTVDASGWKIRIGRGANIYSFVSKFGEAIAPQGDATSAWNDEVFQTVATNRALNDPDIGDNYMIHQAGAYIRDPLLPDEAWWSPSLEGNNTDPANPLISFHCSGSQCSFASWGQQAHISSPHVSDVLYYTTIKDCGNGVVEYNMAIHNMHNQTKASDAIDWLNSPWMPVRGETFRDIMLTEKDVPGGAKVIKPTPVFAGSSSLLRNLKDTAGYLVLTESVKTNETLPTYELPCTDGVWGVGTGATVPCDGTNQVRLFAAKNNPCVLDTSRTASYGQPVIRCEIKSTPYSTEDKQWIDLSFANAQGQSCRLALKGVIRWSQTSRFLIYYARAETDWMCMNQIFFKDDEIIVVHTNEGKPYSENNALGFVHGVTYTDSASKGATPHHLPGDWGFSMLRYGVGASADRDAQVMTLIHRGNLTSGETFNERQYFMTGKLEDMDAKALPWVGEHIRAKTVNVTKGQQMWLYKKQATDNFFGACLHTETCNLSNAAVLIEGRTAPGDQFQFAHFAIRCGNNHYVGMARYHFQADLGNGDNYPYFCKNEPTHVRPSYHLLGFFPWDATTQIEGLPYDPVFCPSS